MVLHQGFFETGEEADIGLGDYDLLLSPNPLEGNILNVHTRMNLDSYIVMNINGVVVAKGGMSNKINVGDLPAGAYFVRFEGEEIVNKRFIRK